MTTSIVCKSCGSSSIEIDKDGIVCTNCGDVIEESEIRSEVEITDAGVVGQFVDPNKTRPVINGIQYTRESTEITLKNGQTLINEMGSQLRLNQHCLDQAFNFYKLALLHRLTRGRKIRQVIAACIYLVCRTEGTPHMLLDLCDIVNDDSCYISTLGKLAMKFADVLKIKLPTIDPGLCITRFAQKLDFEKKTRQVELTASRLVQRMSRDWMATGRRPSGLCGAALLVSARMYGFHRSLDDIVRVVKIGKTTLRKRMIEFEDTPSSNLTVDEFHTIELEEEHDPPAFTRSKKFAKIQQIEEMTNIEEIEKEIITLQENIEAALKKLQKPRGMMAKYAKMSEFEDEILGPNKDPTNIDTEIKEAEEFLSMDQINVIRSIVEDDEELRTSTSKRAENDDASTVISSINWSSLGLRPTLESLGLRTANRNQSDDNYDGEDDKDEDEEENDDEDEQDNEENETNDNNKGEEIILDQQDNKEKHSEEIIVEDYGKETSSKVSVENKVSENSDTVTEKNSKDVSDEQDNELDLNGIDDDEIDSMILSKNEIKTKAKLWLRANKDWLKDQKAKEELKRKEQEESKTTEPKPKKQRVRKPKDQTPVTNPHEAIQRMIKEKKLSSKINYDVLKNLNQDLRRDTTTPNT